MAGPKIDKAHVKLGFWLAAGFFVFSLFLAMAKFAWNKAKTAATPPAPAQQPGTQQQYGG